MRNKELRYSTQVGIRYFFVHIILVLLPLKEAVRKENKRI